GRAVIGGGQTLFEGGNIGKHFGAQLVADAAHQHCWGFAVAGAGGAVERDDFCASRDDGRGGGEVGGDVNRGAVGEDLVDADDRQAGGFDRSNVIGAVGADGDGPAIAGGQRHGTHELG